MRALFSRDSLVFVSMTRIVSLSIPEKVNCNDEEAIPLEYEDTQNYTIPGSLF